jgi:hypothetical protein
LDFQQAFESVNFGAVITAALSAFLTGGLWYSLIFGKTWMKEHGFREEDLRKSAASVFGGSFVLALIIAFSLSLFLGPERTATFGAAAGFMAGMFWVASALGITYLFERKSLKLFLIDSSYHIITFTLMGLIIGAWA